MGNLLTPAGCGTPLGWLLIGEVAETAWAHKASGGQVLTDPGHREADIADALDKLAADPVFPVGGVVVDVPAASREATPDALLLVARLVRVLQQRTGIRLWLVTHGAGAWLRALVRVLAIEHPGLHAPLVDPTGADTDSLVASDGASDHRPVLAVDGLEALL